MTSYVTNVIVFWTICTLVASYGCRCGTLQNEAAPRPGPAPAAPLDPFESPPGSTTRRARIDAIKTDILGKLGLDDLLDMSRLPAATSNATLEEKRRVIELYQQSVEQLRGTTDSLVDEDRLQPKAKQFHSFSALTHDRGSSSRRSMFVRFDIDLPKPRDERKELAITSATLKLYKRRLRRRRLRGSDVRINIYQVLPRRSVSVGRDGRRRRRVRKRLVESRLIDVENERTWEAFDVLKAVRDWVRDPSTNLGLVVGAELNSGPVRLSKVVDFAEPLDSVADNTTLVGQGEQTTTTTTSTTVPLLNLLTRQRRVRSGGERSRRSADDERTLCDRDDGETRCCRYAFWVSFREIGWDRWILAPDGYQAYFCDGYCPPRHRVAHHFAGIKSLVNGLTPDATPAPCCTATAMSPLKLAHFNREGQAVVSVIDDMVVDECMCT